MPTVNLLEREVKVKGLIFDRYYASIILKVVFRLFNDWARKIVIEGYAWICNNFSVFNKVHSITIDAGLLFGNKGFNFFQKEPIELFDEHEAAYKQNSLTAILFTAVTILRWFL